MKKLAVILLCSILAVITASCKKENNSSGGGPVPIVYSDKIVLSDLQAGNDSVVMNWSKLSNPKFIRYLIVRRNYKSANPNTYSYNEVIDDISDASTERYVDYSPPLATYQEYQEIGVVQDTGSYYNYSYVYSNVVPYERPELKQFYFNIKDVLPDVPNHRCYVIGADSGKINILDYHSRAITKEIITNATLGFSALGDFNGVQELYVPRNDGWLYIYNANTLDKIDQIRAGVKCNSVVYNNGKLFIAVDTGYYDYAVRVYDRSSKALITHTGIAEGPQYIALVPGSNTKLFGISSYYLFSFEYDANGHYISWNDVNYNSSYSWMCFEVFPNGQGFITSTTGSIYSGSMTLVQNLPYGNYQYSSFTFNSPFTSIFTGCSNYKNIVEYSYPGYSEKKTYKCIGYPSAIFIDGTNLISLSSVYSYSYYGTPEQFYIETVPLSK
ncbi:MAG: hypothetical protein NTU98_10190 [Bacteroidetes bacterium]|nr:hypothetical protein [Bacteroidota bacterium]